MGRVRKARLERGLVVVVVVVVMARMGRGVVVTRARIRRVRMVVIMARMGRGVMGVVVEK